MTTPAPLTVVVPTFNGARFLADTLESIRRQSRQPIEVLVIDDGSTDASVEVAQSHPLAPRVIALRQNFGVAVARNTGLSEATAPFIAFLDQDDIWLPGRLERISRYLESAEGTGALVTGERSFALASDRDPLMRHRSDFATWPEIWTDGDLDSLLSLDVALDALPAVQRRIGVRDVLAAPQTVTTSYVFDVRLARRAGGFAVWARSMDDWVLLMALSAMTEIVVLDEPSVLYRVHPHQTTASTDWALPLLLTAAAVRHGGIVLSPDERRDPTRVQGVGTSPFLRHFLSALASDGSPRAFRDALALTELLTTDARDRQRALRTLVGAAKRRAIARLTSAGRMVW
jgi:hypothetical protein